MGERSGWIRRLAAGALVALAGPASAAPVAVTIRNATEGVLTISRGLGCAPNPIAVAVLGAPPGPGPTWLCCPLMTPCPRARCLAAWELPAGAAATFEFLGVDQPVAATLDLSAAGTPAAGVRVLYSVTGAEEAEPADWTGSLAPAPGSAPAGLQVRFPSSGEAEVR